MEHSTDSEQAHESIPKSGARRRYFGGPDIGFVRFANDFVGPILDIIQIAKDLRGHASGKLGVEIGELRRSIGDSLTKDVEGSHFEVRDVLINDRKRRSDHKGQRR